MSKLLAIRGSPRRKGNTALLFREAVRGARDGGVEVEEVVLRDLKMSPCLEIYGCKKTGRCAIDDDFQRIYDLLLSCHGVILSSPIFFYTVSAHTKILMDLLGIGPRRLLACLKMAVTMRTWTRLAGWH